MENKKRKIGLALGGGTALGFAHVGVLRALEDHNIKIDYISGTSAGALVATLYAFGIPLDDIEYEAKSLTFGKFAKIQPSKFGILSNKIIEETLKKYIGNSDIVNSIIPLSIIATDISTGEKIVLKYGDAVKGVLASTGLPGIFPPTKINEKLLVDGGIVENVPISPLKEMGADYIIAVNLLRYRKYSEPKNMIGVFMNSFDMVNHRISSQPKKGDADILIEPDLRDFKMNDFDEYSKMAEIGYKETLKFIEEIKNPKQEIFHIGFFQKILNLFPDKNKK